MLTAHYKSLEARRPTAVLLTSYKNTCEISPTTSKQQPRSSQHTSSFIGQTHRVLFDKLLTQWASVQKSIHLRSLCPAGIPCAAAENDRQKTGEAKDSFATSSRVRSYLSPQPLSQSFTQVIVLHDGYTPSTCINISDVLYSSQFMLSAGAEITASV